MGIMDLVLEPENLNKTRQRAERYVSAIYPKPDLDKAAKRSLIRGLGSAVMGAIPYALGAKAIGRGIAQAGAWDAGRMYAEEMARENVHKNLFASTLAKMLEMQTQAYLQHEQDVTRQAKWENFMKMFNQVILHSDKLRPQQLAGALLGAAVESGIDPGQLDMVTKTMSLAGKLAQDPNKAQYLFKTIGSGGALAKINQQTGEVEIIPGPNKPGNNTQDFYRQALGLWYLEKIKEKQRLNKLRELSMNPKFAPYLIPWGDSYIWKPNTSPALIEEANRFIGGDVGAPSPPMHASMPEPEASREQEHPAWDAVKEALGLTEGADVVQSEQNQASQQPMMPYLNESGDATFVPPWAKLPPPEYGPEDDLDRILRGE